MNPRQHRSANGQCAARLPRRGTDSDGQDVAVKPGIGLVAGIGPGAYRAGRRAVAYMPIPLYLVPRPVAASSEAEPWPRSPPRSVSPIPPYTSPTCRAM